MSTERAAHFTHGPRFFTEGEETMFEFVIDAGNRLGPRPATDADKEKHAAAWAEFEGSLAPSEPEPAEPEVITYAKEKHQQVKHRGKRAKAV